jgi:hypothetical protein
LIAVLVAPASQAVQHFQGKVGTGDVDAVHVEDGSGGFRNGAVGRRLCAGVSGSEADGAKSEEKDKECFVHFSLSLIGLQKYMLLQLQYFF